MMCWGMLDVRTGYEIAGEWANAIAALRWGTDYMLKVKKIDFSVIIKLNTINIKYQIHPSANELYVQVGNGNEDHAFWSRAHQWTGR